VRSAPVPLLLAALLPLSMIGCGRSTAGPPPLGDLQLALQLVADGLAAPVHLAAPAGDARLFIIEQAGRIRVVENGQLLDAPFLDVSANVRSGGEQGLLSIAFHPGYATNGRFFVKYTDLAGTVRVVRYTTGTNRNAADPSSALPILQVEQPFANHNGGQLAFGPDGMLYIGMGDGGGSGDPQGQAQNASTLLGALLRIDVDGGSPYRVPPDNPHAGSATARGEIWATGLRNPWRFSFDAERRLLYVADVGQGRREEVNVQPSTAAGMNYGWNRMEGSLCFPAGAQCSASGLTLPVVEYDNPGDGCAVTGGFAYRGSAIPELRGHYFYADYCRSWVRSFRYTADGAAADARTWPFGNIGRISSFGEDGAGELYVISHEGRVYRIVRAP
jgi:glucose/arabinose dehydrogenase